MKQILMAGIYDTAIYRPEEIFIIFF